jgi:hypothetical protein
METKPAITGMEISQIVRFCVYSHLARVPGDRLVYEIVDRLCRRMGIESPAAERYEALVAEWCAELSEMNASGN